MKLYLPVDWDIAIGTSRRRLLELPTVLSERAGQGCRTLRLEFCVLLNVVIICDYKVLRVWSINS